MRLIDADALIADSCRDCPEEIRKLCKTEPACADMKFLFGAPTVDAVPVVQCKGCKHCRELNRKDRIEEAYADGVLWCTNQSDGVWPDDYCSYGERRGGEDG
jgi:hypothetical protein